MTESISFEESRIYTRYEAADFPTGGQICRRHARFRKLCHVFIEQLMTGGVGVASGGLCAAEILFFGWVHVEFLISGPAAVLCSRTRVERSIRQNSRNGGRISIYLSTNEASKRSFQGPLITAVEQ